MKKNKNIDKETRLKNIENAVREILINIGKMPIEKVLWRLLKELQKCMTRF